MSKTIVLLVICQLVCLIPVQGVEMSIDNTYNCSNSNSNSNSNCSDSSIVFVTNEVDVSVHVDKLPPIDISPIEIPPLIISGPNTNPISLLVEIQNNLTSSSIKWGNAYIKSGGMKNSFYQVKAGQKASLLATKNGKGKGSFIDLSPEDDQNTTSGIVTLKIAGKVNSLTLFWEVSSDLDVPNTIGYYWGNQTSNENLYYLIRNEQLSGSSVKRSYETWTEVTLTGEIKMAFFISDQKEATARILLWEEKNYLAEGIYSISWDADLGQELCLEFLGTGGNFIQWTYCDSNNIKQQWIINRNASNWYTIRSNSQKNYALYLGLSNKGLYINPLAAQTSPLIDRFKYSVEKEDGRWRVSNVLFPDLFLTGDFSLDVKTESSLLTSPSPLLYLSDFRPKDDSLSNQLFKFEVVKFRVDPVPQ